VTVPSLGDARSAINDASVTVAANEMAGENARTASASIPIKLRLDK
jgi:hypothetical protein